MNVRTSVPALRGNIRLRTTMFFITLGRRWKKRSAALLPHFDRPGTPNALTEALSGRLEHLRGSALGFRNLTDYIARAPLESGGFRPRLHPGL